MATTPGGVTAGAVPSPNIWRHPDLYEIENHAVDPDGVIEQAIRAVRPWDGAHVLDIGCGTGFHLPRFAAAATRVVGVEPHGSLLAAARRRVSHLPNVTLRQGSAQALPVPDACVDVVHVRWAYFFGPASAPGLPEIDRVVRRGGAAFLIDNDASRSTFGRWFARAHPTIDTAAGDRFFARYGYVVQRHEIRWAFDTRDDFEAVVRIEFAPGLAEQIIGAHVGTEVDYAIVIRVKMF